MSLQGTSEFGTPTARVVVGDTEVPWVNNTDGDGGLEVQMRKTGASALTRFSDITVPYEWGGDDVINRITTPTYLPDPIDTRTFGNAPVRVDIYDEVSQQYVPAHHGPIGGVGESRVSGCFRLTVTDWANYFETVSADAEFQNPSVEQVVSWVIDRLDAHDGIPEIESRVTTELGEIQIIDERVNEDDPSITDVLNPINGVKNFIDVVTNVGTYARQIQRQKSFSEYEDTIIDVLDWLTESIGARWYVTYNSQTNTPALVVDETPTNNSPSLSAFDLSDTPNEAVVGARVLSNNALYELSPQHTLGVRGKKTTGPEPTDPSRPSTQTAPQITNIRHEVVVEHERLADRAGTNDAPPFTTTDTATRQTTIDTAKSMLKKRIDGASGGEIVCLPCGVARPYATIETQPTRTGGFDRTAQPLTYEVEEVIHDITTPTPRQDVHGGRTMLRCGIKVDESDLNVRTAQIVEV